MEVNLYLTFRPLIGITSGIIILLIAVFLIFALFIGNFNFERSGALGVNCFPWSLLSIYTFLNIHRLI